MTAQPTSKTTAKALIVIPAYRESKRLPRLLKELASRPASKALPHLELRFLVVDDGSGAGEQTMLREAIAEHGLNSDVALIGLPVNQGKGGALRAGFDSGLHKGVDYIGFMDADGSVPIEAVYSALKYLHQRANTSLAGVVGSRIQMLGRQITRNAARHYVSRVFATFVSMYFSVRMYDSQCGLKIFRASAVQRYLRLPTDFRWVWDTQLILAMLHCGEEIHELPIDWHEVGGSKVSFFKDPLVMFVRLITFRTHLRAQPHSNGPA